MKILIKSDSLLIDGKEFCKIFNHNLTPGAYFEANWKFSLKETNKIQVDNNQFITPEMITEPGKYRELGGLIKTYENMGKIIEVVVE